MKTKALFLFLVILFGINSITSAGSTSAYAYVVHGGNMHAYVTPPEVAIASGVNISWYVGLYMQLGEQGGYASGIAAVGGGNNSWYQMLNHELNGSPDNYNNYISDSYTSVGGYYWAWAKADIDQYASVVHAYGSLSW